MYNDMGNDTIISHATLLSKEQIKDLRCPENAEFNFPKIILMFYWFPYLVTCIQDLSKLYFLNRLAYLHTCKFQGIDIYKKNFNFFESKQYLKFSPQLNSLYVK